ncbi:PUA-like superfamily [Arabidopsis suecica]|uniref:PUA-like superfamily n=1 Tax=Arabidopsis suecica TaxID=45249 RepID=A0A8T2BBD3_ARASU|nr:PUA-like superfamily [Arabidopsis suecica]
MSRGNYKNPCLTMHQPWASLLVHGIKRIEGRSWPAPIRGRLWIHAASKVPDEATIKAMEEFYQEIYAVDGITDIQFPQHYPVSRLIGCVEVVGCVTSDELQNWDALPQGVRLEGQTNFCWLCEQPQKLIIPFEMRGYQGVYNLENKIYVAAARGLMPSQNSFKVKFPLPDPKDPFSLKPGSIPCTIQEKKALDSEQVTSLTAAIAGAKAAATQFSKKGQSLQTNNICDYATRSKSKVIEGDAAESLDNPVLSSGGTSDHTYTTRSKNKGTQMGEEVCSESSSSRVESSQRSVVTKREDRNTSIGERRFDPGSARIMAAAIRNLKPPS